MSPEEKKILLDFAGPLFHQSKEIDSMYFGDSKTKVDGVYDSGIAASIKNSLERELRSSSPPANPSPTPQYTPPQYMPQQHIPAVNNPPQQVEVQQQLPDDPNQLSFDFKEPSKVDELFKLIKKQIDISEKIYKLLTQFTEKVLKDDE